MDMVKISMQGVSYFDDEVEKFYNGNAIGYGEDYETVHDATDGNTISTNVTVGQTYDIFSFLFTVYRAFLYFDTSVIPKNITITSAKIMFRLRDKFNITSSDSILICNGQPTYPHIPISLADYDISLYSGNGGSISVSSLPANGEYFDINLNSTGLLWINRDGITKLSLMTTNDINSIEPTDYEVVSMYNDFIFFSPLLIICYKGLEFSGTKQLKILGSKNIKIL